MELENQPNRVESLIQELISYLNLRWDAFKLNMVENLSLLFGNMTAILIAAMLAGMAFLLFTTALVWWLGTVMGSFLLAIVVVGACYLIAAWIVFLLRDRLITDRMVRMFSQMFFNPRNKYDEGDPK